MKIDLCVLAAGNARRFCGNKLLCEFKGKPLIRHLLDKIDPILFSHVYVVTQYDQIASIAREYDFEIIMNDAPDLGIGYSIKLASMQCQSDAIMFVVSDQPFLKEDTIKKMVELANHEDIIALEYDHIFYNPMIFPAKYLDDLKHLQNHRGAKQLIKGKSIVSVPCDALEIVDIDTREDLNTLM